MKTASEICAAILNSNLSRADLNDIASAFNTKNKMLQMVAAHSWKRGDKVQFRLRSGKVQVARVLKVNQKTVTCEAILTADELKRGLIPMSWNVGGTLLSKAA